MPARRGEGGGGVVYKNMVRKSIVIPQATPHLLGHEQMRREGEVGQVREGFGDRGEMIRGSTAVIPELHRRTCPVLTCKESSPLVLASRCSRMAKCVYAGGGNTERKIKCL